MRRHKSEPHRQLSTHALDSLSSLSLAAALILTTTLFLTLKPIMIAVGERLSCLSAQSIGSLAVMLSHSGFGCRVMFLAGVRV